MQSSVLAPAARSAGAVYSAALWQIPLTLGTRIIAAGQVRASICVSYAVPDGMRRRAMSVYRLEGESQRSLNALLTSR